MLKRMLLPAALIVGTLGFGLTPTASAGWFRHNAAERHERAEHNRYYSGGYGYSNAYTYYGPSYSNSYGYRQNNNHGNNGYYNNGYRYNSAPSYSNGHNTGRQAGHGLRH